MEKLVDEFNNKRLFQIKLIFITLIMKPLRVILVFWSQEDFEKLWCGFDY